jgi:hypothetical protein
MTVLASDQLVLDGLLADQLHLGEAMSDQRMMGVLVL